MVDKLKEQDKRITDELGLKTLARVVGYSESGEPVELVYDASTGLYDWHIGGEYMKQASQQSIEFYSESFNRCPLV